MTAPKKAPTLPTAPTAEDVDALIAGGDVGGLLAKGVSAEATLEELEERLAKLKQEKHRLTLIEQISALEAEVNKAEEDLRNPDNVNASDVFNEIMQLKWDFRPGARFFVVNIPEDGDECVDPVPLSVNGVIRAIKRGEDVIITESMLECLRNAVGYKYNPTTKKQTPVPSYPHNVIKEVTREEAMAIDVERQETYARTEELTRRLQEASAAR